MPQEPIRILVVDKDTDACLTIKERFSGAKYEVEPAQDGDSALLKARANPPHFVLLDLHIPGTDSLEVLRQIKDLNDQTAVIVLSDSSDPRTAVDALELGAEDFIAKPFDVAIIEIAMKNILERRNLQDQVKRLKHELERDHMLGMLVGESPQMVEVRELINQVAGTDLNILIRGESGTGKDVTARIIHQLSNHKEGPFVKVNCAALPENLIEAELFGYEKGAFTGAVRAKPGRFQLAHGGTIFLDEITEIPFPLQSKLLQVLEQREFVRVGGTRTIKVDCRCIAATNADMELEMLQKGFREDLYFRMNEFTIMLPPLRERKEDIPLLIDYFLSLYSERYQRKRKSLNPETVELMMRYPWPGNVRELESLLKRVLVLDSEEIVYQTIGSQPQQPDLTASADEVAAPTPAGGDHSAAIPSRGPVETLNRTDPGDPTPEPADVPEPPAGEDETSVPSQGNLKSIVDRAVENAEKAAILDTLNRTRWNRRKAAAQLGISYSSLLRRIAKYNLAAD